MASESTKQFLSGDYSFRKRTDTDFGQEQDERTRGTLRKEPGPDCQKRIVSLIQIKESESEMSSDDR